MHWQVRACGVPERQIIFPDKSSGFSMPSGNLIRVLHEIRPFYLCQYTDEYKPRLNTTDDIDHNFLLQRESSI